MADRQLLCELLKEDQEPFQLKSYIEQRRSHLKETTLQVKKRKPIILETTAKRTTLCKQACFFSFQSSPDIRKSPFHDLYSPCKSPNGAVFLHIPAGTAALLADAAMRIHKHKSKPKTQIKNVGFGLFGSILKRLKDRNNNKKRAIGVKNEAKLEEEGKMDTENRISCSCNNSRISSAGWSEYNEEKSIDLETSTSSCRSEYSEIINDNIVSCENRFCVSPFRFSLQTSPSLSGHLTPDFCSPSASPIRHKKQEKENGGTKNTNKVQEEVSEEKEQCSPVSVLDPPFEDEEDEHESGDVDEDDYDLECSYANVQRTKQQLLYRLRRFEKLAELDPMELERKLLEESDDDDDLYEREELEDEEPLALYKESRVDKFVTEVFNKSILQNSRKISTDMTRLVSDLITEEKREMNFWSNKEIVLGRVCNRLDSWREVEFDTIDMMIDLDFKREYDGWKKYSHQVEETAAEIELEIYGLLMEELSDELSH
ncbi:hypothetical protein Fot_36474 [Forsythia ovata]|uniref:DUF4378 domain-containing protein n=1 Tax=Forsythia ovata TaxID=205694 RepID=A0ABD1SPI3_9LAMI